MKAFILAAGFGTRLRPWTLYHPKALVPVGGRPMLERVLARLRENSFKTVIVNVHHFSDQIIDFIENTDSGIEIYISDESGRILDTGGALLKVFKDLDINEPLLIHNVDILSNADLKMLAKVHIKSGNDVTLLTSGRESSRKLLINERGMLCGWHNIKSGEFIPASLSDADHRSGLREEAFSGIYIVSPTIRDSLEKFSVSIGDDKFPIMNYFLSFPANIKIGRVFSPDLELIDIGKPETLALAEKLADSGS